MMERCTHTNKAPDFAALLGAMGAQSGNHDNVMHEESTYYNNMQY